MRGRWVSCANSSETDTASGPSREQSASRARIPCPSHRRVSQRPCAVERAKRDTPHRAHSDSRPHQEPTAWRRNAGYHCADVRPAPSDCRFFMLRRCVPHTGQNPSGGSRRQPSTYAWHDQQCRISHSMRMAGFRGVCTVVSEAPSYGGRSYCAALIACLISDSLSMLFTHLIEHMCSIYEVER